MVAHKGTVLLPSRPAFRAVPVFRAGTHHAKTTRRLKYLNNFFGLFI